MTDEYNHLDFLKRDAERHALAVAQAKEANKLNSYRELHLCVSETGSKHAVLILTRAPVAEGRGIWNLSAKDRRTVDVLVVNGWKVSVHLFDESAVPVEFFVPYGDLMATAVLRKGRGTSPDYWEVRRGEVR